MASRNGSSCSVTARSQSRTCLCAPTSHPGSFRCSNHKKPPRAMVVSRPTATLPRSPSSSDPYCDQSISMAAIAKANSLKAILLQIIKQPSTSHDVHRRKTFHPKPTRFSLMNRNTADHIVAVN